MNIMKKCRRCLQELNEINSSPSFLKRKFKICRECNRLDNKNRVILRRKGVIEKLGNKCQCCGIDNFDFLSIDHIDGGGIKDRNSFKGWSRYIRYLFFLSEEELNLKYRCLCFNCNCGFGFWDRCPHVFKPVTEEQLKLLPISNRGVKKTYLSKEDHKKREDVLEFIAKLKNKLEMIVAYGGKCVSCNEDHPLFLTLDHMNNNGNLEKMKKGNGFYKFLRRQGYPGKGTQLQLLCHNCNQGKEYAARRLGKVEKATLPEIYIKQEYNISEEEDKYLWDQSRRLYVQIKF